MHNITLLLLNVQIEQDNNNVTEITNEFTNAGANVITANFWRIPPFIKRVIKASDIQFVVLSSILTNQIKQYTQMIQIIQELKSLGVFVIAYNNEGTSQYKEILVDKGKVTMLNFPTTNQKQDELFTYIKSKIKLNRQKTNKKIAHIGIAVNNIDEALPFYQSGLELELTGTETVSSEGVKVAFLKIGDSQVELIEPLSAHSPVQKFIDRFGEGIHHIALEVDQIHDDLIHLSNLGIKLINEQAKIGANQSQIAFIHPKSTSGVLIELCQIKRSD